MAMSNLGTKEEEENVLAPEVFGVQRERTSLPLRNPVQEPVLCEHSPGGVGAEPGGVAGTCTASEAHAVQMGRELQAPGLHLQARLVCG